MKNKLPISDQTLANIGLALVVFSIVTLTIIVFLLSYGIVQ